MTPGPGIFRTQLPKGFSCGGINSGVRRYRPDLGIIISEVACVAAGVFTQSTCKAAPVIYNLSILPSSQIRAIVTNSGQANAATGKQGVLDNQAMVDKAAAVIGCEANQVLSASTGVIGEPLQVDLIEKAIVPLIAKTSNVAEPFALAILTTDLVPKTIMTTVQLSQGDVHITGICKGSGMIHPNMATMLGYLLTDIKLTEHQAQTLLKEVTDVSFNMVSVDGDTSTNDSVFLMANGMSEVSLANDGDLELFKQALLSVAIVLAKSIARDGEGATKLIEAKVSGALTKDMAKKVARTLILSPLIKTAVHGESPNWGRVLAHLGALQIPVNLLESVVIKFQQHTVFAENKMLAFDLQQLRRDLKQDTVTIDIQFMQGTYSATAWGCDLSKGYVEINAGYVT